MNDHFKDREQLKKFLDEMVDRYNRPSFITDDPISIPKLFTLKEDIEISGFLTAVISWGQRAVILKNAIKLTELMENEPHNFLLTAKEKDFRRFNEFVHRTFNGADCVFFLKSLQRIYKHKGGLEEIFKIAFVKSDGRMEQTISLVRHNFFNSDFSVRSTKHFADPLANSSAKRINMFLRWMIRNDKRKVDFGIWKNIPASDLYCPLDLHSGRIARQLGLLTREQDDWKAVSELTKNLRLFDSKDPVKYDFALFGLGVGGK